jgi:hypothetical protein
LAADFLADVRHVDLTQLPADIDAVLRFHPRCPFGAVSHPCLLALMRRPTTDEPTGIHRIALTPEVFAGGKVERRALGSIGVIKLWPATDQLIIAEGLETALAAATCVPFEGKPLRPAWSLVSKGLMTGFPVIAGIQRLIILIDHDKAGIAAAKACTQRWSRARRTVVQLLPDEEGADFNDLILSEKHDG